MNDLLIIYVLCYNAILDRFWGSGFNMSGGAEGFIAKLLLYIAPMYFSNSCAMVFGGGRTRLDLGKNFSDGKPIFGEGKTLRGFVAGVTAGTTAAFMIAVAFPAQITMLAPDSWTYVSMGFLLSLGAIVGDLVKSFFKRRAGIAQGKDVLPVDQLDFVAGGIIFGLAYYAPSALEIAVIAAMTVVVHRAANFAAFKLRLKKVPW